MGLRPLLSALAGANKRETPNSNLTESTAIAHSKTSVSHKRQKFLTVKVGKPKFSGLLQPIMAEVAEYDLIGP